ncbi:MAG: signal recognition particle-docking protein FtsY [archaeon]
MFEFLKKKLGSLFTKSEPDTKKPEKAQEKIKRTTKREEKSKKLEKKQKKELKELPVPGKFNVGTQQVEPDLEKLPEIVEEIEQDIEKEEESEQSTDKSSDTQITTEKKQGFFSKLFSKIAPSGKITLKAEHVDQIYNEIEMTLLENNVALEVADKIKEDLYKNLLGKETNKKEIEKTILSSLKQSILEVLIESPNLFEQIKDSSPYVILFFGINGSGKTTSIAKLAHKLKKQGISCIMAAGDTFRAASIEQLQTHGERLKIPVIAQTYGSDPSAVAFDAIAYAKKHKTQVVLIDTAGRMYTKANLLKEMEKIVRVSKPNLKIFVGESITGNDATEQAKTFNETIGIDGIILSKADVDEKAGTILSVSYVTKKPIYFLGTGQDYDDLTEFKKADVIKNLGL